MHDCYCCFCRGRRTTTAAGVGTTLVAVRSAVDRVEGTAAAIEAAADVLMSPVLMLLLLYSRLLAFAGAGSRAQVAMFESVGRQEKDSCSLPAQSQKPIWPNYHCRHTPGTILGGG